MLRFFITLSASGEARQALSLFAKGKRINFCKNKILKKRYIIMKQYAVETKFNGTIAVSAIDEFNAEELTIEVLASDDEIISVQELDM